MYNLYDAASGSLLTAAEATWAVTDVNNPGGRDCLAGLTLPHSRLGRDAGPSYPVWFPSTTIRAVGDHIDAFWNNYEGARVVVFNLAFDPTLTSLGVIANPFAVWGNVPLGGTYPLLSLRRSQIPKGDFLYVWYDEIGTGDRKLGTFPILGEAKATYPGAGNSAVVVFDPNGVIPAVGVVSAAVPALLGSTRLKIWLESYCGVVSPDMIVWLHHAEYEAIEVSQRFSLPLPLTTSYADWYHEEDVDFP